MMPKYVGSPWRSRFLRAPKVALRLSERRDFVPLETLASVHLGLKTGADKFFFLTPTSPDKPQAGSARGHRYVKGLAGGWEGYLPRADIRAALLNPHALIKNDGRLFLAPREPHAYYVVPRDRAPQGQLAEYILAGERAGVSRLKLVLSNASAKRWYRQSRKLVTSRWALPYNSGYEYGAVDNGAKAVLNGRFVGVDSRRDVDEELLGAILNTTFVMAARLIEGTATGVEGAFDVGPPAVRRMMVPDPRLIKDRSASAIYAILGEMRQADTIPPAPDRHGAVDDSRARLDVAVLRGLGLTKGEAAAIAGTLYESYARWRGAVEDVEQAMRVYRREMSRHGRSRSAKPTDIAARRIWEEMEYKLPVFPSDLLEVEDACEEVDVSRQFSPPAQEPLFEQGLVILSDGSSQDLGSYDRVRYTAMLMELGFEPPLQVVVDSRKAGAIATLFDEHRSALKKEASKRAKSYISDSKAVSGVVDSVQRFWFRKSRTLGMTRKTSV